MSEASGARVARPARPRTFAALISACVGAAAQAAPTIQSATMEPTLHAGDPLVVDVLAYAEAAPARGDVVYFSFPGAHFGAVSRVVGVPGDRLSYDADKQLTINGAVATWTPTGEPAPRGWKTSTAYVEQLPGARHRILINPDVQAWYRKQSDLRSEPACRVGEAQFECVVPPGRYFLMGDNRDDAKDSRYFGFVAQTEIGGRLSHGDAPLPIARGRVHDDTDDTPAPMEPPRR